MRDYSKIRPSFWTRGTGKRLRGDANAQVIAAYLMTGPQGHMTGVYYCPLPTLVHETGVPLEGVAKALARVSAEDFAHFDEECDLVWVPNMAREQIGDSLKPRDNIIRAICKHLATIGNHPFCLDFVERYRDQYSLPKDLAHAPLQGPSQGGGQGPSQGGSPRSDFADPLTDPLGKALTDPLRSQDQDQEQEQEQDPSRAIPGSTVRHRATGNGVHPGGTAAAAPLRELIGSAEVAAIWNRIGGQRRPGLLHAHDSWRGEFATVAAALNGVKGSPALALAGVMAWFWDAPNGPFVSGRLKLPSPKHLAKGVTEDLEHAIAWWQAERDRVARATPAREAAQ